MFHFHFEDLPTHPAIRVDKDGDFMVLYRLAHGESQCLYEPNSVKWLSPNAEGIFEVLHRDDDSPAEIDLANNTFKWYKNGKLHRGGNRPAVIGDGILVFARDGKYHRSDGEPAVIQDGNQQWYKWGKLHSYNGNPSSVEACGTKTWHRDGVLHREDGPAFLGCEHKPIKEEWYRDGLLHREDGPAIECWDGRKVWYNQGKITSIELPSHLGIKVGEHPAVHDGNEIVLWIYPLPNTGPYIPIGDESCSICNDPMIGKSCLKIQSCGHSYCESCLLEWATSQRKNDIRPRCPLCRAPIVSDGDYGDDEKNDDSSDEDGDDDEDSEEEIEYPKSAALIENEEIQRIVEEAKASKGERRKELYDLAEERLRAFDPWK